MKNINEVVNEIINIIGDKNIFQVYVDNNCILGCFEGVKDDIVLYKGNDLVPQFTYNVLSKLKYILNFTGKLNNDNIMI